MRGLQNARDIFLLTLVELAEIMVGENLGKADNRVERRAQFIENISDKLEFEPVGGFQRLRLVSERTFDPKTVGNIEIGDQRRAVGKRY
ncbi:MAG: hypothetical protein VCD31_02365, partial [Alphaproteobacteria bacterium]